MLEFRILGPLEVREDGAPVEIPGRRQRFLLTILVLHANEAVSQDRLVDLIWGEHPPPKAVAALHNAVSQLRTAFGPLGRHVLTRKPPGYRLVIEPEQTDLGRFERLVREARGAPAADRKRLLDEA